MSGAARVGAPRTMTGGVPGFRAGDPAADGNVRTREGASVLVFRAARRSSFGYLDVPVPVPVPAVVPSVPVPAAGLDAPALPAPAPFGTAVPSAEELPIGMLVAGICESLLGADRVALGFDEFVPFCEFEALAAKADDAARSVQAATAAVIVIRFIQVPSAGRPMR